MKSLLTTTVFSVLALIGVAQDVATNSKTNASFDQEKERKVYQEGQFTVKLKSGVGDFSEQAGTVSFNIPTLDAKVLQFNVYKVEKRFKYNPKKARTDLPDLSRLYKFHFTGAQNIQAVVAAFAEDPNVEYASVYLSCMRTMHPTTRNTITASICHKLWPKKRGKYTKVKMV